MASRNTRRKYINIISLILIVALIIGIYGYKEYSRKLPDTGKLKADYSLKAADLLHQFEADERKATLLYSDKIISVEGIITSVEATDSSGTVFLNAASSMASVMCQFEEKNFQEMLNLQKGSVVTIKGVCSGYLMDVVMVRCVLE